MYHCYLLLFSPGRPLIFFILPNRFLQSFLSILSVLNPLFNFLFSCIMFIISFYLPASSSHIFPLCFVAFIFLSSFIFPCSVLSSLFIPVLLLSSYSLPFIHLLCSFICYLSHPFCCPDLNFVLFVPHDL